jgi:hypothetical protein
MSYEADALFAAKRSPHAHVENVGQTAGFATVKREGVEVKGAGVMTIPAEMRVGAVSETF